VIVMKTVEVKIGKLTVPISSTNNLFIDLLLRVIAIEVYYEITVPLNMHAMILEGSLESA